MLVLHSKNEDYTTKSYSTYVTLKITHVLSLLPHLRTRLAEAPDLCHIVSREVRSDLFAHLLHLTGYHNGPEQRENTACSKTRTDKPLSWYKTQYSLITIPC